MEHILQEASDSKVWAERFEASLNAQRTGVIEFLAEQQERLDRAEAFVAQELRRLEVELAAQREQADRLRAERDALAAGLADAGAAAVETRDENADEKLRKDLERALSDLRQARSQNAELQDQVARSRSTASKVAQHSAPPGRLDWEAEKRRILLALENDFDANNETQQHERLKIADVLRTTDEAIASRDREIQALKAELEACRGGVGAHAVSAATEQTVGDDPLVREERERLKRLQEQWSEKVREAEVELAVERAKLARQRVELEEQIRAGSEKASTPADVDSSPNAATAYRGRWLARLGLTDADREPRRVIGP